MKSYLETQPFMEKWYEILRIIPDGTIMLIPWWYHLAHDDKFDIFKYFATYTMI